MKSDELMKTVQAFLGSMREGDMKGLAANLLSRHGISDGRTEDIPDKYREVTGKNRPALSYDENRETGGIGFLLSSLWN